MPNSFSPSPRRTSRLSLIARSLYLLSAGGLAGLTGIVACSEGPLEPAASDGGTGAGGGAGGGDASASASAQSSSSSTSASSGGPMMCALGYDCVDEAPAGYEGYFRVIKAPHPSPNPGCPDGAKPFRYLADPAGSAQCSLCPCSRMGGACSAPEIKCYYGVADCSGAPGLTAQATAEACVDDTSSPAGEGLVGSCALTGAPFVIDSGTCKGGKSVLANPASFETDVFACLTPAKGQCGPDKVCVLGSDDKDEVKACLLRPGVEACPEGWPKEITVYEGAEDTRACSACGCGPAACEGGSYALYDGAGCDAGGAPLTSIDMMACFKANGIFDGGQASLKPTKPAPVSKGCTGGEPVGAVNPIGATKLCCR